MDTLFQTDYEIHKTVAGGKGNTIYEADNILSPGTTVYECVKKLSRIIVFNLKKIYLL